MAGLSAIIKKLAAGAAADKKSRHKILIIVGSIAAGLLLLLFAPIAVLATMSDIEPPKFSDRDINAEDYFSQLSPEQLEKLTVTEDKGQAIAEAMKTRGLHAQTIKAQLIYMSFFECKSIDDLEEYAAFFTMDDEHLIQALNEKYGIEIAYGDFMRTYTMVMNSTINEYMFTDTSQKNAGDLAAWCRNAYVSGWGYAENTFGERTGDDRIRCADNAGLITGYICYDTEKKEFSAENVNFMYTIMGNIETMPDVQGVGVYNGRELGVYVGGGKVIFSSAIGGCVQRENLSDGSWTQWCTFKGIAYPQETTEQSTETTTGA